MGNEQTDACYEKKVTRTMQKVTNNEQPAKSNQQKVSIKK